MREYLVEIYVSRLVGCAIELKGARARAAAEQLAGEGRRVRLVRWIFVPEDETCFFLYEAASLEDVQEATRRAGIPFERAAEALTNRRRRSQRRC